MAKATIWIRVENEGKWRAIKDKSAWVNSYLKVADIKPMPVDLASVRVTQVDVRSSASPNEISPQS